MKISKIILSSILVFAVLSIFLLSSQKPIETRELTALAVRLMPAQLITPRIGTKVLDPRDVAHIYQYSFLCLIAIIYFYKGYKKSFNKIIIYSLLISAFISISDQIHKYFVPGREFDMSDFKYDIAGYGSVIICTIAIRTLLKFWVLWVGSGTSYKDKVADSNSLR